MLYLLNFVEFLFAKSVAYLLRTFGNIRRKIADKNLEVCFPELDESDRSKILNKHYGIYDYASSIDSIKDLIISNKAIINYFLKLGFTQISRVGNISPLMHLSFSSISIHVLFLFKVPT